MSTPGPDQETTATHSGDEAAKDYAKGSEQDQEDDAPTGKEGTTPGDESLPDDQAAFQPESS